ncbi:MAG: hypothetical protein Q7K45_03580, partial [Nanoarchaeota archaeon]|nr:hypothetical protein [Nanoarchaeota archaeon]
MYTSDAVALLHGIVKGDIKLDDAIKIAQDRKRFFRELVRIKKDPEHIGAAAVEAALNKACRKFVQRMNELHNSLPSIRFASAKDLTAEELYVLIVYGESEVFTSTFNGLFNMLINRMGREGLSGTTLLDKVNYNKFRAFVKLLASYGRLNEFLKTMTQEAGSEFLERFAKDIDKESDSLAEAVIVADVFGLVKDRNVQINFQKTVRDEYGRARGEHSKEGITLYSLLSGMFGIRNAGGDQWLKEVSKKYKLPTLSKLSAEQLFDRNGINFQRYHFYGETAGVESFSNFLAQYKNDKDWAVKDEGAYVHITSKRVNGKKVEIYANKWDISDKGNTAIDQLLEEKKVKPSVIVYRGHSYQVEPDLGRITSNAALVFLGS